MSVQASKRSRKHRKQAKFSMGLGFGNVGHSSHLKANTGARFIQSNSRRFDAKTDSMKRRIYATHKHKC